MSICKYHSVVNFIIPTPPRLWDILSEWPEFEWHEHQQVSYLSFLLPSTFIIGRLFGEAPHYSSRKKIQVLPIQRQCVFSSWVLYEGQRRNWDLKAKTTEGPTISWSEFRTSQVFSLWCWALHQVEVQLPQHTPFCVLLNACAILR